MWGTCGGIELFEEMKAGRMQKEKTNREIEF
jgi:hypothetical protein